MWDRIEIIAAGTSDSQLDVNQAATVWFIAVYRYENRVFKGVTAPLYVNGEPPVWNPDTEVWARASGSTLQGPELSRLRPWMTRSTRTKIRDDVGPQNITWGPSPWRQQWLSAALGIPASRHFDKQHFNNQPSHSGPGSIRRDRCPIPQPHSAAAPFPRQALAIILASGIIMVIAMLTLLMAGKKSSRTSKREHRGRS